MFTMASEPKWPYEAPTPNITLYMLLCDLIFHRCTFFISQPECTIILLVSNVESCACDYARFPIHTYYCYQWYYSWLVASPTNKKCICNNKKKKRKMMTKHMPANLCIVIRVRKRQNKNNQPDELILIRDQRFRRFRLARKGEIRLNSVIVQFSSDLDTKSI